jgi:glycosyltransferase involved in cell wall biosynthesis
MRVALFTDADVFAGTERHMLELGRALKQEGVEPTIACPDPSPLAQRAKESGIGVIGIGKHGILDWRAILSLRRALRSGQIELIHAHNGRTKLLASVAVRLAKTGRVVATQHFLQPNHSTHRGVKAVVSRGAHHWVNAGVHRFIAISKASAAGMLERAEASESDVCVVLNGMAAPDLSGLKKREEIRAELRTPLDAPVVVCVARLVPEKDIPTLIDAMRQVVEAIPTAVCWIAGEGSQREALALKIKQSGIEKSVKLLEFREDALSLINAADLFVLPSLAEPFGLVLLEAMALGKAVVATQAGGPLEIVEEGRTGLLVTPSKADEMSVAIQKLLGDSALRQSMGQAGRNRFEEKFSAQAMARATLNVYRQALACGSQADSATVDAITTSTLKETV